MTGPSAAGPLLEVRDLRKQYERTKGWMRRVQGIVKAVDGILFEIQPGETLSLVGESGCSKTTTGRCIVRGIEPTSGEILFDDDGQRRDLVTMGPKELAVARRKIRMIFQDPFASLNPRMTVLQIVGEPLHINGLACGMDDLMEQVVALLKLVQLDPRYGGRFPNAFSGGQRQRIAIARALALDPKLVIADGPVSALDVSVQAQILNLMKDLQQERGLTYLFVAHNLAVVRYQSDRIAVMYLGRIVELSTRDEIFERLLHPYTEMLLLSSPTPDPRAKKRQTVVIGDVPHPAKRPSGCAFNPRCRFAQDICRREEPPLIDVAPKGSAPHHGRVPPLGQDLARGRLSAGRRRLSQAALLSSGDGTLGFGLLSAQLRPGETYQTANLAPEAGHDQWIHNKGADAEPIPDLEFDQTLGW